MAPSGPVARGNRIAWIDGLRGIAALQVVLLHYATAFLPGLGLHNRPMTQHRWERIVIDTPLFFALNGYAAVYLFFLLSGVVLTCSFARRPFAVAHWALRRLIRLGLPMCTAVVLGGGLLWAWPTAHVEAAAISGSSGWLGAVSPRSPTLLMAVHQMLLEGMIAGYRDASLLPGPMINALDLETLFNSLDAPLWTLHYEFIGSLLVLVLVALRAAAPRGVHLAGCGLLCTVLAATPLVLFILGHLAAPLLGTDRCRWRLVGVVCMAIGLLLCSGQVYADVHNLLAYWPGRWLVPTIDPLNLQCMFGELFVFAGVALLPVVRQALVTPLALCGGRISFSLYLLHFPVLFTLVCALFLKIETTMPYSVAASLCSLIGISVSLALAVVFERWIDRPSIRLSRLVRLAGH